MAGSMLLRDGTTRDDSGILMEYRGRRMLNLVDCSNLNAGVLPGSVDLLLGSFAGGASGFPVCWGEQYDEAWISARVKANRHSVLASVHRSVELTSTKRFIPFAGFFAEAHPSDASVRRLNVKNKPEEVCTSIRDRYPGTDALALLPGDILDLGTGNVRRHEMGDRTPQHDFEVHLQALREDADFAPLLTDEGILHYFRWAGFRGDLILHVVETDDDFDDVQREFLLACETLTLLKARPREPHRYLRMRVRSDVFRHVLRRGLPWEDIAIGFNARFYRDPGCLQHGLLVAYAGPFAGGAALVVTCLVPWRRVNGEVDNTGKAC